MTDDERAALTARLRSRDGFVLSVGRMLLTSASGDAACHTVIWPSGG